MVNAQHIIPVFMLSSHPAGLQKAQDNHLPHQRFTHLRRLLNMNQHFFNGFLHSAALHLSEV